MGANKRVSEQNANGKETAPVLCTNASNLSEYICVFVCARSDIEQAGLFFTPFIYYSLVVWLFDGNMVKKVQIEKSLIRTDCFRLKSNILIGIATLD